VNITPAPRDTAMGATTNRLDPRPTVTVRPAAIPSAAPKITSLA